MRLSLTFITGAIGVIVGFVGFGGTLAILNTLGVLDRTYFKYSGSILTNIRGSTTPGDVVGITDECPHYINVPWPAGDLKEYEFSLKYKLDVEQIIVPLLGKATSCNLKTTITEQLNTPGNCHDKS